MMVRLTVYVRWCAIGSCLHGRMAGHWWDIHGMKSKEEWMD